MPPGGSSVGKFSFFSLSLSFFNMLAPSESFCLVDPSPGRIVSSPTHITRSRIPLTMVPPMLLIRIVNVGIARRDQKTNIGLPALLWIV